MVRNSSLLATLAVGSLALTGCEKAKDLLSTRSFTVSATSMEPTLAQNATFRARPVEPSQMRRGDILIVTHPKSGEEYVKRLIGLPRDELALREGQIILNAEPVEQRAVGPHTYTIIEPSGAPAQTIEAIRLRERLPGSNKPHFVLDHFVSPMDEYGPVKLGGDEYFLLGDNRDHSADSRFARGDFGLGIVNGEHIRLRVDLSSVSE